MKFHETLSQNTEDIAPETPLEALRLRFRVTANVKISGVVSLGFGLQASDFSGDTGPGRATRYSSRPASKGAFRRTGWMGSVGFRV